MARHDALSSCLLYDAGAEWFGGRYPEKKCFLFNLFQGSDKIYLFCIFWSPWLNWSSDLFIVFECRSEKSNISILVQIHRSAIITDIVGAQYCDWWPECIPAQASLFILQTSTICLRTQYVPQWGEGRWTIIREMFPKLRAGSFDLPSLPCLLLS